MDLGRSWSYVGCVHTVERVVESYSSSRGSPEIYFTLHLRLATTKNRSAARSERTFSKQLHKHLPKQAPGYICLKTPRTSRGSPGLRFNQSTLNSPTNQSIRQRSGKHLRRRELAEVGMSTFWLRTPKNGGENLEHFHYPSVVNPQGKCIIRFAGTCGQTP